jgi:carboxymethylenebutenolidase
MASVASSAVAEIVPQQWVVESNGRPINVTRYAAAGEAARPAVLVLHGSSGPEADRPAYARHAQTLAARWIDAYLMSYFAPGTSWSCACWGTWTATVLDVAHAVRQRPESSGRIGLLGFSLGGGVAVAGARDPRVAGLVVFYGALPDEAWRPERWPPVLVLHGDADTSVPLRDGAALVELARRYGGRAELAAYRGAGHRLSTWDERAASDAVNDQVLSRRADRAIAGGQRKAAPPKRRRAFTQALPVSSAHRTADAEPILAPAGAAIAEGEPRAAATGRIAAHAGAAALGDLFDGGVGRKRRDRHGLRGAGKAERSDERGSNQCLHGCSLLGAPRALSVESNRGARTAQSPVGQKVQEKWQQKSQGELSFTLGSCHEPAEAGSIRLRRARCLRVAFSS